MRQFRELEQLNLEFLVRADIPFGLLEQTKTTLDKAYSDATQEFREFLNSENIHDYAKQPQGQDSKALLPATVLQDGMPIKSEVALYRPRTKNGDPRFRISHVKRICEPGDISAVLHLDRHLYIFRLDEVDLEAEIERPGLIQDLILPKVREKLSTSAELLSMIQEIARRGFIRVHRPGDTAVGHLLETELGIQANSSKSPDYKGIEIKSSRARVPSRLTMFAKVPDWRQSSVRGVGEFLEEFGYERRGYPELNCQVGADRPNSLGLQLRISSSEIHLEEFSTTSANKDFSLKWELEELRTSLKHKHTETFWVKATSDLRSDGEYIRFDSVKHTSKPVLQQFVPLVQTGAITVDHLISKKPQKGVKEQGPLFKISTKFFDTLFPLVDFHDLHP